MWVPHPSEIIWQRATGLSDMGDVTDPASTARYGLDVTRWCVVAARGTFSAGTGTATLYFKIDHRDATGLYDTTLWSIPSVGTDGDAAPQLRVMPEELVWWTCFRGDQICLEWTNPDDGTMRWGMELGLVDASNKP